MVDKKKVIRAENKDSKESTRKVQVREEKEAVEEFWQDRVAREEKRISYKDFKRLLRNSINADINEEYKKLGLPFSEPVDSTQLKMFNDEKENG